MGNADQPEPQPPAVPKEVVPQEGFGAEASSAAPVPQSSLPQGASAAQEGAGAARGGETEPRDVRIDAAFAAYLRLCDARSSEDQWIDAGDVDERQQREVFLAQHAELQPELGQLIATADMLERFVGGPGEFVGGPSEFVEGPGAGDSGSGSGVAVQPVSGEEGESRLVAPDAETIGPTGGGYEASQVRAGTGGGGLGAEDNAANQTLPIHDRPPEQSGPRLPYDLGDYMLEELIGRGGMGMVYRAKQKGLKRDVAVKMIRSGVFAGEHEVRRFRTEAQAAARLQHPNIVTVHHFGYRDGHHYFSMDYVPGTDLSRVMAEGPLEVAQAARYVRDCARAIHYAHQHGILHRDIKPANLLIDQNDRVCITDFGLAKHTDTESSITGSGAAVGTPNYMSPEQALGHGDRADQTSDVYSLGAVLFALLTGRPPFAGENVMQTLMQVVHRAPPSPRELRPELPLELEAILLKCLEKQPQQRYVSAAALADDLDRFLAGRPVEAKARTAMQRVWYWVNDVPLVAALRGRRLMETSRTHHRVQTAALVLLALLPIFAMGLLAFDRWNRGRMPAYVRIAGGLDGGVYDDFSGEIARRISRSHGVDATVVKSDGSLRNRQRLLEGALHLAPLQASTMQGEDLCVVAPLFYEHVHVLVRPEAKIESIEAMAGRTIAVGPEGSGSRLAAELLFDSFGLSNETVDLLVVGWSDLEQLDRAEGAIVCMGTGSPLVTEMLRSGRFVLLEIPDAFQVSADHPTLRPLRITSESYPDRLVPVDGVETVGMPAFLAARFDTPSVLVRAALDALYESPAIDRRMISRSVAAEFQGMQLHPEARRYFNQ